MRTYVQFTHFAFSTILLCLCSFLCNPLRLLGLKMAKLHTHNIFKGKWNLNAAIVLSVCSLREQDFNLMHESCLLQVMKKSICGHEEYETENRGRLIVTCWSYVEILSQLLVLYNCANVIAFVHT